MEGDEALQAAGLQSLCNLAANMLGDGCIVAAGAVVTASAPEGATLAGNPARAVKRRGEGRLFGAR